MGRGKKLRKIKPMSFKGKLIFSFYTVIIGFGYFGFTVRISIEVGNDPNINNSNILVYFFIYFALLTIPAKFAGETVYVFFGNLSLIVKWFIMFIAIFIPLLYPTLAFIDLWALKKTGIEIKEEK